MAKGGTLSAVPANHANRLRITQVRKVLRWLFPRRNGVPSARDLVADNLAKSEFLRSLYGGGFAIVPTVGLAVMVVNLFYRVRGNSNLALEIILAIPISALAMVILLGFINFLLIGLTNALAMLVGQDETSPRIRNTATSLLMIVLVIGFATLPWFIFIVLTISAYVFWRSERVTKPAGVSVDVWVKDAGIPLDRVLRDLWNEGRWVMKRDGGVLIESAAAKIVQPDPFRIRKIEEIFADILKRQREISETAPSAGPTRIIYVLATTMGVFAAQLFFMPINFAPMELVTLSDGNSYRGYALGAQGGILFVDSELSRGRHISSGDVDERVVCAPSSLSKSLLQISARRDDGPSPRCSSDEFDWPDDW